jgi:hypothetical protein
LIAIGPALKKTYSPSIRQVNAALTVWLQNRRKAGAAARFAGLAPHYAGQIAGLPVQPC